MSETRHCFPCGRAIEQGTRESSLSLHIGQLLQKSCICWFLTFLRTRVTSQYFIADTNYNSRYNLLYIMFSIYDMILFLNMFD